MISAFATPIVNQHWTDVDALNAGLVSAIEARRKEDLSVHRSNVGGWHSGQDLMEWPEPPAQEFAARVRATIQDLNSSTFAEGHVPTAASLQFEAWANVLGHGAYNSLHVHPNSFWSGVYYVTANPAVPDQPFSGKLELIDPRPAASVVYAEHTKLQGRFLVNPIAGQLVIFPSWLQHCVHSYQGEGQRISIAFNVTIPV